MRIRSRSLRILVVSAHTAVALASCTPDSSERLDAIESDPTATVSLRTATEMRDTESDGSTWPKSTPARVRRTFTVPTDEFGASIDDRRNQAETSGWSLTPVAEFERGLIRERTTSDLGEVRQQGRVGGRPSVMDDDKLSAARAMRARGASMRSIGRAIGVSASTVCRHLAA